MYWSFAEERERGKKDSLKPSTESSVLTPCNISGYLIGLVMGQKTNKHKKEPIFFSFVNQLWLRPDIYQPKIILLTKLWLLFYFCRDLPVVRSSLECWWFHSQIGVRKVEILLWQYRLAECCVVCNIVRMQRKSHDYRVFMKIRKITEVIMSTLSISLLCIS